MYLTIARWSGKPFILQVLSEISRASPQELYYGRTDTPVDMYNIVKFNEYATLIIYM